MYIYTYHSKYSKCIPMVSFMADIMIIMAHPKIGTFQQDGAHQ